MPVLCIYIYSCIVFEYICMCIVLYLCNSYSPLNCCSFEYVVNLFMHDSFELYVSCTWEKILIVIYLINISRSNCRVVLLFCVRHRCNAKDLQGSAAHGSTVEYGGNGSKYDLKLGFLLSFRVWSTLCRGEGGGGMFLLGLGNSPRKVKCYYFCNPLSESVTYKYTAMLCECSSA